MKHREINEPHPNPMETAWAALVVPELYEKAIAERAAQMLMNDPLGAEYILEDILDAEYLTNE